MLQVQRSLNERLLNIEQFDNHPSAPDDNFDDDTDTGHIYPSLQNLPTMPRCGFREIICGSFTNQLEISVVEEIFWIFPKWEGHNTQHVLFIQQMSLEATFSCKFGCALQRK